MKKGAIILLGIKWSVSLLLIYLIILIFKNIDNFEIFVYRLQLLNLNLSFIAVRLLISIILFFSIFFLIHFGLSFLKENKYKKIILTIVAIVSLISPFIISPPDSFMYDKYAKQTSYNKETLSNYLIANNFSNGKHIICFFGTGCGFCELTAQKIAVIRNKTGTQIIKFVFWGDKESIRHFFSVTKTSNFDYDTLHPRTFLDITDGEMPLIVAVNNNNIQYVCRYRDLDDKKILKFLE